MNERSDSFSISTAGDEHEHESLLSSQESSEELDQAQSPRTGSASDLVTPPAQDPD